MDKNNSPDELQRRRLQEYIFRLEEFQEEAEDLVKEHDKLKHTQELLLAILSATTNGICLIKNGLIRWGNKGLNDICGWENNQLIGKSLKLLFREAGEFNRIDEKIKKDLQTSGRTTFDCGLVRKNNQRISCIINGQALSQDDPTKGYILTLTEITDRKKAEEDLKKAHEELEKRVMARTADLALTNEKLTAELVRRKETEKALRENEKRYRTLFESANDAIFLLDGLQVIDCNAKALDLFNCNKPDILVHPPHHYSPDLQPDGRDSTELALEKIREAESGRPQFFEWQIRRSDGLNFYTEVSLTRIELDEGNYILAIVRDITGRKRTAAALEAQRERLDVTLRSIGDGVITSDLEQKILLVNKVAEDLTGWTQEKALGKRLSDILNIVDPDSGRPLVFPFHHLIARDGPGENEIKVRLVHENGRERTVSLGGTPIRSKEHDVIGLVLVMRDITEKEKMDQELRQTRNYLQNVIDSMPSILVGINSRGLVTWWNKAAINATGVSSENAWGQPLVSLLPVMSSQMDRIETCLAQQKATKTEKYPTDFFGPTQYFDVVFYPLATRSGNGAVIRMDDVTERVRIEEIMVQTEKMASVGTLAAGVAHEINNPLAGVLQGTQMLERRLDTKDIRNERILARCGITADELDKWQCFIQEAKIESFLSGIHDSGLRAAKIVNDLLEFSRKSEISIKPHPLHEVVDRALSLAATDFDLKRNYDIRKIKLIKDYSPDLDLVLLDPQQIQQVIMNLVKNAAQALSTSPARPGFTPMIRLSTRREDNWATIEVADNGQGIPRELQDRIFEPFFTTKPVGEGTGLGLYISFGIIRNHGGVLKCHTTDLDETCFSFNLPL